MNNYNLRKLSALVFLSLLIACKGVGIAKDNVPLGAQALIESYPAFIKGYANGYILYKDGSKQIYDDKKKKSYELMLDNSDLEDMFYVAYRLPKTSPGYLEDAGRSRNEALFKRMYGSSATAVRAKMVTVNWFGQRVQFSSVNGAANALKAVAKELAAYPQLRQYLKSSGTFNWRTVRGAKRQSAHSYGIAFDIGVAQSDYWLWRNKNARETTKGLKYYNRYPHKIVEIFQRHGFIWGGAWYHYDTMHFEYRPEILRYAQLKAK